MISLLSAVLLGAFGKSGLGHALAQAALFHEGGLQLADLLVEQVIGLVKQANEDVRHDLGRARVHWSFFSRFTAYLPSFAWLRRA